MACNENIWCYCCREEDANETAKQGSENISDEWAPWNLELCTKSPNAPPPVNVKTTPGPAWDIGQVRFIVLE